MYEQERPFELSLQIIGGKELSVADLDQLTRALIPQLEEIEGLDAVNPATDNAAERGSKGLSEHVGKLLLHLKSDGLPKLFQFLKDWVNRPGSRPLKIKAKGISGEIEVEFDPETITAKKVQEMALALQSALNQE